MSTKFAEFLETSKIDPRRLISASRQIERLRPEDRVLRRQRAAKKSDDEKSEDKEAAAKPRSGRPVTPQLLERAKAGKKVPGAAKTRLLRAVNHVLEQRKADPVDLRALF